MRGVVQKTFTTLALYAEEEKLDERKRKRTTERKTNHGERREERQKEKQSRKVFSPFVLRFSAHTYTRLVVRICILISLVKFFLRFLHISV